MAPLRTVATAASVVALTAAAPAAHAAVPGAPGIGDRLFPTLGNGGYDAQHYVLDLRFETVGAPATGVVTMNARATQDLSSFDLDFAGGSVGDVTVNGAPAGAVRDGEELVVTPDHALPAGHKFQVRVPFTSNAPTPPDTENPPTLAYITTPDGTAALFQPNSAHLFFPSNDHPRDKATYAFRIDVPAGVTAVANGVRTGKQTAGGRTVWRYLMRQPMASELTQIVVGDFLVKSRGALTGLRADGQPVAFRDVVPRRLADLLLPVTGLEKGHFAFLKKYLGATYPFDVYGSLIVDVPLGVALETQTLTIYDTFVGFAPREIVEPTMVHEETHQWFGDSVSPWEWSDVWLNEGHATWYQNLYAEQQGFLDDDYGIPTNEELMRLVYSLGDEWRDIWGPVALPTSNELFGLFNPNVYEGGQLVLYALRERIGQAKFERLEREWVKRHEGGSASTEDYIALASEVAGEDLGPFLRAWLYGTTTPPMPNHPDWTQEAASPRGAAARCSAAAWREVLQKR